MRGPTDPIPSPAHLLARRAAAQRERPWLFYPDGPDWRWRSYGAVAEIAAGRAAAPVPAVGELVTSLERTAPRASALAAQLAPLGSERGVTVLGRRPEDPAAVLLVRWSLLTGAALVLEPAAGALVPTAAWARPTLFLGTAGEVAALAVAARRGEGSYSGGWWRRLRAAVGRPAPPRRPFRRLGAVVLAAPVAGAPDATPRPAFDAAFWQRRGVACIDLRSVLL